MNNKHKLLFGLIILLSLLVISSSVYALNLTDNLIAYYNMSQNTYNSMNSKYNITSYGTNTYVASCKLGGCYQFTGNDQGSATPNRYIIAFNDLSASADGSYTLNYWGKYPASVGRDATNVWAWEDSGSSGNSPIKAQTSGTGSTITVSAANSGSNSATFTPTVDGNFHMYTFMNYKGTNLLVYEDAVLKVNQSISKTYTPQYFNFIGGAGSLSWYSSTGTYTYDEVAFYQRSLSSTEVGQLYNGGAGCTPFTCVTAVLTNITFKSQSPSDLNSASLFGGVLNITYNYTLNNPNLSSPYLNYSVSYNNSCLVDTNGTCTTLANTQVKVSQSSNSTTGNSSIISYVLTENQAYPIRQNFNISQVTGTTIKTILSGEAFKDEILNIPSSSPFGVYEVPITVSGNSIVKIYYYNSSYTVGNILTSPYVTEIVTLNNSVVANHTHNASGFLYNHTLIPYAVINGKINNVSVNGGGFIIYKVSGTGTVTLTTLNYSVRSGSGQSGLASGIVWTADNTLASHTHIFDSNTTISYKACGTFGANIYCTSILSELIDVIQYAPQPPVITVPFGENYTQYINITWLNASSTTPNTNISSYTIYVLDQNLSQLYTLNTTRTNNYYWNTYNYNLSVNTPYYIRVTTTDTNGLTSYDQETFQVITNAQLNVTAINIALASVNNFSITYTGSVSGIINTTTGVASIDIVRGTYTLFIDSPTYAYSTISTTANNPYNTYQFNLQPTNSINITIRDETTNALVTQNTILTFNKIGDPVTYTYQTSTGNVYPQNLLTGNYTLRITSPTPTPYTAKTYAVSIPDRSTQTLTAYLNTGGQVLLNTKDAGGNAVPNVLIQMQRVINSSWVVVEQHYSDITGRSQFTFVADTKYRFNATLDGYVPVTFELDPILFTSYDIPMSPVTSGQLVPTGYAVWSPGTYKKNQTTQFQIQFISPYDSFTSYQYNVTYPGGSFGGIGNNSNGQTFNNTFIINSGTNLDYVTIYYQFNLNNGATQNFTYKYTLVVPLSTRTISDLGNNNYGFLIGDKVVILAVIMLVIMGVAWLAGGFFLSLIIGGIFYALFLNSGFILANEQPLFYTSAVIILLLLIFRGRQ